MKRAWTRLTQCRIGQEKGIIEKLKAKFPEFQFKTGTSKPSAIELANLMNCPDRWAVVYVLLPCPHPNEISRKFYEVYHEGL